MAYPVWHQWQLSKKELESAWYHASVTKGPLRSSIDGIFCKQRQVFLADALWFSSLANRVYYYYRNWQPEWFSNDGSTGYSTAESANIVPAKLQAVSGSWIPKCEQSQMTKRLWPEAKRDTGNHLLVDTLGLQISGCWCTGPVVRAAKGANTPLTAVEAHRSRF